MTGQVIVRIHQFIVGANSLKKSSIVASQLDETVNTMKQSNRTSSRINPSYAMCLLSFPVPRITKSLRFQLFDNTYSTKSSLFAKHTRDSPKCPSGTIQAPTSRIPKNSTIGQATTGLHRRPRRIYSSSHPQRERVASAFRATFVVIHVQQE